MTGSQSPETADSNEAVRLEGFSLELQGRMVLNELSVGFTAGQSSALVGPMGAGKSALLRVVVGLEGFMGKVSKRQGSVIVLGKSLPNSEVDLQRFRRRVVLVPSNAGPFPCSVMDNVLAALKGCGLGRHEIVDRARDCLEHLGFSGSEIRSSALALDHAGRRFLALARAMALEPKVLLIDEPFEGLDPYETRRMSDFLGSMVGERTVIFASQHVEPAAAVATDLTLLVAGKIIESGTTLQMLGNPADRRTEAYFSGRPMD